MGAPAITELFERARERSRLAHALDEARAGRGGVLVVEGAAGIGKTAMVDLAARLATARGLRPLRARGSEIESDVPLITLRALFERSLAELAPARRESLLRGAAAPLARALELGEPGAISGERLHRAALLLVTELANSGPLVLLVDDLHNADASTLTVLAVAASAAACTSPSPSSCRWWPLSHFDCPSHVRIAVSANVSRPRSAARGRRGRGPGSRTR